MIKIEDDEKLIAVYRRHVIVLILFLLPVVLFSVVIIFAYSLLVNSVLPEGSPFVGFATLVLLVFLHMIWLIGFISTANYYLDVWILTDKRVIAIEQISLFARTLSEFELSKIQEVGVDVEGILPTLIEFGDVRVSTASENPNFKFKQVGHPNQVKDAIMDAVEADRNRELPKIS